MLSSTFTPLPPCPKPFNLADYVLAAGRLTPEKVALEVLSKDSVETWRYSQIDGAVRCLAAALLAQGFKPGDRLMMRLGNHPLFPITYLAAIFAGLIPAPTSAQLTLPEVTKLCETLEPSGIVTDGAVACPETACPVVNVQVLLEAAHEPLEAPHMCNPNALAYIVFTSGTSGTPQAVMHAHRAIWARQSMHEDWYGLKKDDRMLHAGAFNWTFTLGTGLLDPWSVGARALVLGHDADLGDLPALLAKHDATIFAAAPGVYRKLLKDKVWPEMPKLKRALSAGEKLPSTLRDAWTKRTGVEICEAYGMTECSTFLSDRPGSGSNPGLFVQRGRVARVHGANASQIGEIAVHRNDPGLMLGYWRDDARTKERFDGDWFLTGDQAIESAKGGLTLLGRSDDMLNAGGFRVSPLEIEGAFESFDGVLEMAAVELRVGVETTVIAAFYVSEKAIDDVRLSEHAAKTLARYKQPRLYIHKETLPKGPNNKLLRKVLRTDYEAQNGQA
ncbi:MAG: class I adenylate-forming enzyme family protein [Pseudomonadota bacterium]